MSNRRQPDSYCSIKVTKAGMQLLLIGVIVISNLLTACGSGNELINPSAEAQAKIGPSGGMVEVINSSSPLNGVKVEIPEGALAEDMLIGIDKEPNPPSIPPGMTPVGPVIRFSPDGIRFNSPITITLKYDTTKVEADDLVMPLTYGENEGYWHVSLMTDINPSTGTVEIITTHFTFSTVFIIQKLFGFEPPSDFDTGFRPQRDGFSLKNPTLGFCDGMTAFSQWLYKNHPECGGLHTTDDKTAYSLGEEAQALTWEPGLWRRLVFAFEGSEYSWQAFLTTVKTEIAYFDSPYLIARWQPGVKDSGHAILAYKYEGDVIWYYDPNRLGEECQLTSAIYNEKDNVYYGGVDAIEAYSPADFEQLFNKYKTALCSGSSSLIGTWSLLTINGEKPYGISETMAFTENTWRIISTAPDATCTEVSTYSASGGILRCTGVLSVSGEGCADNVGDTFTLGPYTITDTTLTIKVTNPPDYHGTIVFVFGKVKG